MARTSQQTHRSVVVVGDICHELRGQVHPESPDHTTTFLSDGTQALSHTATRGRRIWFVADELPDMTGVDCVKKLVQARPDDHFYLVTDADSGTHPFATDCPPRTRYLCGLSCYGMLKTISDANTLSAYVASKTSAISGDSPIHKRGRAPPS